MINSGLSRIIIPNRLRKANVTLTVCTHRYIDIDVMQQCLNVGANREHNFSWRPVVGYACIALARTMAATYFYRNQKSDILLFIDDDIIFEPEDVVKVINHVMDGKLICGAMYVQKGTLDKTIVLEEGDTITFGKDEPVKKVVCISTGFMAIHRKVFEEMLKMKEPNGEPKYPLCDAPSAWENYPFFNREKFKMEDGRWKNISEDWAFCLNARRIGIDTWIDPTIMLGHKGLCTYDLRDKLREPKISWEQFESITLT